MLPKIIIASFVYLLVIILTSIGLFAFNPPVVQLCAIAAIILWLVVLSFIFGHFSQVRNEPCYFLNEITLLPEGGVQINNQEDQTENKLELTHSYKMHLNSRVGLLGCWLKLTCEKGGKVKEKTVFIFKSNVSQYHYSQLCRMIKRNASRDIEPS